MTRIYPELKENQKLRFISNIKFGTCWEWTGCTKNGYGLFNVNNEKYRAHRVGYELFTGEKVSPELVIDHMCLNKICVNPAHLQPVTQGENVSRSYKTKGLKYMCKNGHPLEGYNLIYRSRNRHGIDRCERVCRTCKNINQNKWLGTLKNRPI